MAILPPNNAIFEGKKERKKGKQAKKLQKSSENRKNFSFPSEREKIDEKKIFTKTIQNHKKIHNFSNICPIFGNSFVKTV